MNGTFFAPKRPENFTITPAIWPKRNPGGKSLQAYLTDYVINTYFIASDDTGTYFNVTTLLQKFFNITVTSDDLGLVIPEILTKYGAGKPVDITAAFLGKQGVASFSRKVNTLDFNLSFTVMVDNEVTLQGSFDGISVATILNSKNGAIYGNLSKSTIGHLGDFRNSLGMDALPFQNELQDYVTSEVTSLNSMLAAGLVIPTIFGINASDVEINTHQGYIELGINATPATFLDIQQTWVAYKAEYDNILSGAYKTEKNFVTQPETRFLQ